jgi:hypothetical protein
LILKGRRKTGKTSKRNLKNSAAMHRTPDQLFFPE